MTLDPAVESVRCRAYRVPTDQPEADGTLAWDATTLVLVEACAAGVTGSGWTYASPAVVRLVDDVLADVVTGRTALDIPAAWEAMVRRCRNLGRPGLVSSAVAAVDIALWDLKARLLDLPLCRLLGQARDTVPVYGSGGFTTYDDTTTRHQLESWVGELGIPRIKIKVGEAWGARTARDLARVALAREAVGPAVELYVDANGAYSRAQAVRMARAMDDQGVTWFEEPVSSDDVQGLADVRRQVLPDVAAGEYVYDLAGARLLCEAGAVDCLQLDVTRCAGVTEWLRAAALAAAYQLDVSAHTAPQLHAHVAAAVPHLRHVEWFHDHVRLEQMLFEGVIWPEGGELRPAAAPGLGVVFREADAERFRVA